MSTELRRRGYNNHAKYCVSSLSRCGSTMMVLYLADKFGMDNVAGVHARQFVEFKGKVVFLFGNPFNTVVSVHEKLRHSLKQHYVNMGGEYSRWKEYLYHDSLHLEDLFNDWYRPHQFPMVSVRYETLWDNLDKLGSFIGIDMSDFPEKKKRETDWRKLNPSGKKAIKHTYRRLNNKIDSAKDFKIWLP